MSRPPVLYFAYGSNLHASRIRVRVPSAVPVTIGYVASRRLMFHKRSVDGSAKADACFSSDPNDRVWGALYRIDPAEKPILDQHEFLGIGYDQEQVSVTTVQGTRTNVWMYVARPTAIDASLRPYCWYLDYVIRGAYQHRLPLCYIRRLHQINPLIDTHKERKAANGRILD